MKKSLKKKNSRASLTTLSSYPEALFKDLHCLLLHEKSPIYHEGKIYYVCMECRKEKDRID